MIMVGFSTSVLAAVGENQRPDPTLNMYVQPRRFDLHGKFGVEFPSLIINPSTHYDPLYSFFHHPLAFTLLT